MIENRPILYMHMLWKERQMHKISEHDSAMCHLARPVCLPCAEAIEHREGNWSKRRLLLDVGATDAHGQVSGHGTSQQVSVLTNDAIPSNTKPVSQVSVNTRISPKSTPKCATVKCIFNTRP